MRVVLLLACAAVLTAAPQLRLSQSAIGPINVAVGANGPTQTVDVSNIGDGRLALSVSVDAPAAWLGVTCCEPIQFQLNTASLSPGTYTADVTVSDPHAIDSPQVVTVTVRVGNSIDQYISPGHSINIATFPGTGPAPTVSTQDGGMWLAVTYNQVSTLRAFGTYFVHIAPPSTMVDGTYHGTVNQTIPVTMHLTRQPIAWTPTPEIRLRLAQGGPAMTYPYLPYISLANSGDGTLTVDDVTGTGSGVSAYNYEGLGIVTVDPGSLPPGTYNDGLVTFQCNAANCPLQVPVRLEVIPRGPPVIRYQGVVDNVTFSPSNPVCPGDVVVARGEQLSLRAPGLDDGVRVLVNDVIAHLYYTSFGQIAFQMPDSTTLGTALVQVIRDGVTSNTVSVQVVRRAPRIVAVTGLPAKAGDPITIWAIGCGPLPITPTVQFTTTQFSRTVTPTFAGLAPGYVGLYQINATVPQDAPSGSLFLTLRFPDSSDSTSISTYN